VHNPDQLKALSDTALLTNLESLSTQENEATVAVLLHLVEVERRELHLAAGHASLFAYCTQGRLRYAETAALRRISSARAVARFPELVPLLLSKELSITTLSLVAGILSDENKQEVLEAVKGQSRRAVDEFVSRYRPRQKPRETVRPLAVVQPVQRANEGELFQVLSASTKQPQVAETSTAPRSGNQDKAPLPQAPTVSPHFELRFTIGPELMREVEEARVLLSSKFPKGVSLEALLGAALETLLEKYSPKRRELRRAKRLAAAARKNEASGGSKSGERVADKAGSITPEQAEAPKGRTRNVTRAKRDQVLERDERRCTFVGTDGIRCGSRHDLEVHHEIPFGQGGSDELSNLKTHCACHNLYQAKLDYGAEVIGSCVRRVRSAAAEGP
jgi:5-methylcytosine-specific restriction endonuclease McrA